MFKKFYIGD